MLLAITMYLDSVINWLQSKSDVAALIFWLFKITLNLSHLELESNVWYSVTD